VQGAMPKRMLIERFRQGGAGGQRGCVLVASASFWEGIDVPGDALQLVIIDKLPFPPPNDPMAEARSKALEDQGRSAFNDYFVPEAAVALKQGAGRLIRRETDHGVLVVCDTRLVSMGYGKRLLRALPPMKRLTSDTEMSDQLTKVCTRGRSAGRFFQSPVLCRRATGSCPVRHKICKRCRWLLPARARHGSRQWPFARD
jgi:ATP-dependent DNA helicase DinG